MGLGEQPIPRALSDHVPIRAVMLAGALGLILATPVWPGFQEGRLAYERGDYATAVREWRPLAEQGNATAQYILGGMYANGQGVRKDEAEAVRWYRKAAEQGNPFAQYSIGFRYDEGLGVRRDPVLAYMWYYLASANLPDGSSRDEAVTHRDQLGKAISPSDRALAEAMARNWKPAKTDPAKPTPQR